MIYLVKSIIFTQKACILESLYIHDLSCEERNIYTESVYLEIQLVFAKAR